MNKINVYLMRIVSGLFILVLFTTSIISGRYARFAANDTVNDQAKAAAFIFDVSLKKDAHETFLDLSSIKVPGNRISYGLTVTNKDKEQVSEVSESYVISVELKGSLPIICTLDGALDENNAPMTIEDNGEKNTRIYTFEVAAGKTDTYTLHFNWPVEEKDLKYADAGISAAVLTVRGQQLD